VGHRHEPVPRQCCAVADGRRPGRGGRLHRRRRRCQQHVPQLPRSPTDAQPAFRILGNGGIGWGPGAAGAIDTFLSRNAAGILQLGTTAAAGTLYLFGSAAGTNELATFVAAEAQARWAVTADGTTSWGAGGASARDTTIGRSAAGQLNVLNKVMEALPAAQTKTVPATFTPDLSAGPVQRCNVTAGGAATLTIAAPTSPPSSIQTAFLVVRIANTGGGTVTLTWNGAFIAGPTLALPASVTNGSRTSPVFFWDGANWQLLSLA
jgi:hypothetical protein